MLGPRRYSKALFRTIRLRVQVLSLYIYYSSFVIICYYLLLTIVASSLLFPRARYLVWDTHLFVHGSPGASSLVRTASNDNKVILGIPHICHAAAPAATTVIIVLFLPLVAAVATTCHSYTQVRWQPALICHTNLVWRYCSTILPPVSVPSQGQVVTRF